MKKAACLYYLENGMDKKHITKAEIKMIDDIKRLVSIYGEYTKKDDILDIIDKAKLPKGIKSCYMNKFLYSIIQILTHNITLKRVYELLYTHNNEKSEKYWYIVCVFKECHIKTPMEDEWEYYYSEYKNEVNNDR